MHTTESVQAAAHPPHPRNGASFNPASLLRRFSSKAVVDQKATEVERQAVVMSTAPHGLYERFRRGLLEYHSEVRVRLRPGRPFADGLVVFLRMSENTSSLAGRHSVSKCFKRMSPKSGG